MTARYFLSRQATHLYEMSSRAGKKICSAGADFLFPPQCSYCFEALKEYSSTESEISWNQIRTPKLCSVCTEKLPLVSVNNCLKCGASLGPYQDGSAGCIHCKKSKFAFSSVASLHLYEGDLRKMCQVCKTNSFQRLTRVLADTLWKREQKKILSWKVDFVVNVPMHWKKRLARHVHPSDTIAQTIANHLKIPYLHRGLIRVKDGVSQSTLAPSRRRSNVRGIYRTGWFQRPLAQKRVLLVDDVLTTGSTADACAKALKKSGAEEIFVLVLARGVGH